MHLRKKVRALLGRSNSMEQRNIVLHEYKTIYFFIPKVASSSLKYYISDLLKMDLADAKAGKLSLHDMDFPYVPLNKVQKEYQNYFKFCIVRNPWDRVLSCYLNKICNKSLGSNPRRADDEIPPQFKKFGVFYFNMPFDEFTREIVKIPDSRAENHFKSQHCFMQDDSGNDLVDFIGHIENLEADFAHICERTGLPHKQLERLVHIERPHYKEFYSDSSKRDVAERFQIDIKKFGYEF